MIRTALLGIVPNAMRRSEWNGDKILLDTDSFISEKNLRKNKLRKNVV